MAGQVLPPGWTLSKQELAEPEIHYSYLYGPCKSIIVRCCPCLRFLPSAKAMHVAACASQLSTALLSLLTDSLHLSGPAFCARRLPAGFAHRQPGMWGWGWPSARFPLAPTARHPVRYPI